MVLCNQANGGLAAVAKFIMMKNPTQLLPMEVAGFKIRPLKWADFKGQVNDMMPWSAHIYWWIEYKVLDYKKKKLHIQLHINPKSWVRHDKKSDHLLNHEQGHYLLGAICALEFLRRVDSKKAFYQGSFDDLTLQTFERTMKEYLEIEKKYDSQTEHRLNYKKQEEWDEFIFNRLNYYHQTYDKSKSKFVKLSGRPPSGKAILGKKK